MDNFPGTIIFNEEDKSIDIHCDYDESQLDYWLLWTHPPGFDNYAMYRGYIYRTDFQTYIPKGFFVPEGFLDRKWVKEHPEENPPFEYWTISFFEYWLYFFNKYPDYQGLPFCFDEIKEWYEIYMADEFEF